MSQKAIWIVSTKSTPMENCPHNEDGSEFFYVDCLLPAEGENEALAPIKSALGDERLSLVDVTRCEAFDLAKYEGEDFEIEEVEIAAQAAERNQKLTFSIFVSSEAKSMDQGG